MGQLKLSMIPGVVRTIIYNIYGVFIGNTLEFSNNLITKGMYFIFFVCTIGCILIVGKSLLKKKEYVRIVWLGILLIAFEVAINSIFIMCSEGIYSLMYYSYIFLAILPICLIQQIIVQTGEDNIKKNVIMFEWISVIALSLGIGSYCHYANGQYLSMELSYEQAYSYLTTLVTQIKSTKGYHDDMPVAFVGDKISDRTLYENDVMDAFLLSGRDKTLIEAYSRTYMLMYYCGFSPEYVDYTQLPQQDISVMPTYPNEGSIRIIDGTIVVKFSE